MADALREEYQAIVDAGFLLQIDDPFLTDIFSYPTLDRAGRREARRAVRRGDQPRPARHPAGAGALHTCYGINEGPRVHDAALEDVVDMLLKINAGAYSFEAANPRTSTSTTSWRR